MTDPGAWFRSELGVLRDHVVGALRADNVSRLKEGLHLYSRLVGAILQRFRVLEEATGTTAGDLRSFYGPEMVWLEDDIRTFVGLASRRPATDATHEVLGFVLGLVRDALERRELTAFGSFLQYYRLAWEATAEGTGGRQWSRTRESLLLTLENLGDYWLGRRLEQSGSEAAAVAPFAERFLGELVQLGKLSIDEERPEDLSRLLETLASTLRQALHRVEERWDRLDPALSATDSDREQLDIAESLQGLKAAGMLALDAWSVFRHKAGRTDADTANVLVRAIRQGSVASSWKGYMTSRDARTQSLLRWSWWEIGLWKNRSGVLAFQSTVERTFAAHLLEGRVGVPTTAAALDIAPRHAVDSLTKHVSELSGAVDILLPLIERPDEQRANSVLGALENLREALQREEDDAVIGLDLCTQYVDDFQRAVVEEWLGLEQIRSLVRWETWQPSEEDHEEPSGFGVNTLVPKDYFLGRPAGHANAAHLGREFGSGLARSEGGVIIAELGAQVTATSTTMAEFARTVEGCIDRLKSSGFDPLILVVNSWRMVDALRHLEMSGEGGSTTADLEQVARPGRAAASVLLRYTESHTPLCVVADFHKAVVVRHKLAQPEQPGDEVVAEGRLLVSVRQLDEQRAIEMINANERFRSAADGSQMSEEDAVRTLLKQVHVRVLEWLTVDVVDPTAAAVIRAEGEES